METIYRIESKVTGNGFYNHGHYYCPLRDKWYAEALDDYVQLVDSMLCKSSGNMPHPMFDGIEDFDEKHFFGFLSLDQLASWFPPSILAEIVDGELFSQWFHVVTYSVEEEFVLYGNRQVAFERAQAVTRTELTSKELSHILVSWVDTGR